jgi:hypothetical protein
MKMGARLFEKLRAMQVTLFKIKPLCGPGVPFSRLISPENTFEAKKLGNETDAKNSNDGCSPKDLLGLLLQVHRKCRLSSSWWPRDHSIGSIDHGHCCFNSGYASRVVIKTD